MTFPDENPWRDRFNLCALNRSGGRQPRYYQEIAIKNVLEAVAKQRNRILLTMATGTGKTYTAFQICWKLTQTKWSTKGVERAPRILFIADRNILANQAINDFDQFPEDAMCRVTPKELRKNNYRVPTARNLYFTIFQTMMTSPNAQKAKEQGVTLPAGSNDQPYYMQYERNFFDFIIIDECHRGGANDESEWRKLMEYFDSAYQLGMTATPRRKDNANTYAYFGEPVYTYSLKQGIEDGWAQRVEVVKRQYVDKLNKEQREFDNLILQYYLNNGFKELGSDNLKTFITIKFNSMSDAKERLNMTVPAIRAHYIELQRQLYRA